MLSCISVNSVLSGVPRLNHGFLVNVPYPAGAGAGVAVSVDVIFNDTIPASYAAQITTSQAAFVSVANKTVTGLTVTLTPPSNTSTIEAGTFDLTISG